MNALLILIPVSFALVVLAAGVFFWAVRHDQFEDLDTPKILPLLDEESRVMGKPGSENRGQSTLSPGGPKIP